MLPGPVIIFTRLHILPYAVLLRNAAGISIEQKQKRVASKLRQLL